MRAIILAGGKGTRLGHLTRPGINKHTLPVGRYPMIYHPIARVAEAGIRDIMVVTGVEHAGSVIQALGSGAQWGLEFTYRVQDTAGGIAEALSLCEDFAAGGPVIVVLGDNIFDGELDWMVRMLDREPLQAVVGLRSVKHPERFGVPEVDSEGNPGRIIEKPLHPDTDMAVIGVYAYPEDVFDRVRLLRPSARQELEITDLNNLYIDEGRMTYLMFPGLFWTDAGTPESYAEANGLTADLTYPLFD